MWQNVQKDTNNYFSKCGTRNEKTHQEFLTLLEVSESRHYLRRTQEFSYKKPTKVRSGKICWLLSGQVWTSELRTHS